MNFRNLNFRKLMATGAVIGLLGATACGDDEPDIIDPDPEPDPGTVTAVVYDEPADAGEGEQQQTYTGALTAQAQVEVSLDGTEFVALDQPAQIEVALRTGDRTVVHSQVDLDEGQYSQVRLVLTDAQVRLDAGSTVGETTLEEEAMLAINTETGENEVIIDVTLPTALQITAGQDAGSIAFNLNSDTWITEEAVQAELIAAATVQQAVEVELEAAGTTG